MATTYLTRAQVAGNRQTFTQSFWVKLSNTTDQGLISSFNDSTSYSYCYIDSSTQQLQLQWKSGSVVAQLNTNRKFRDTSGWYNIIYAVDTTQSTDSDRIKLYINGVQETSFSTATYPGQILSEVNDNGTTQYIGSVDGTQQYVNGSMSYVAQIDGTQELPGIFGETDSTTGEWKIKTTITPSVAWGNNGFLILKNGNSVTDQSGEGNNFAVTAGTLTNTEDCPSNNFATFAKNYLARNTSNPTFSNGGTTIGSGGDSGSFAGAIAPTTGKYYWEVKIVNANNSRRIGIVRSDATNTNSSTGFQIGGASGSTTIWTASYDGGNGYIIHRDGVTRTQLGTTYATYTTNDIIGVAVDCDNYTITWYKNNTLIYALSLNATYFEGGVFPANRHDTNQTLSYNFGNGVFGTTAVASAGTNASGNGIFEYDVPTGYTALSTKGLNL